MNPKLEPSIDIKKEIEHNFELNTNKFKMEEINVTECPEYSQSYCAECLSLFRNNNCLFKQLKRQQYYLEKIRAYELNSLDVDWNEYEQHACDTEYSPIIDYVELALGEKEDE